MSEDIIDRLRQPPLYYILDDLNEPPIPCDSVILFAHWWEPEHNRVLAWDRIGDDVFVSTIFTGMNLSPFGVSPMFETMILGGRQDRFQVRCDTYAKALEQHGAAMALAGGVR